MVKVMVPTKMPASVEVGAFSVTMPLMPTVPSAWALSVAMMCGPPPRPAVPGSVGPTGGVAADWLVTVTSPATIALPDTNTGVRLVRPTFSPLMTPLAWPEPSDRLLAAADTVHGRLPDWVSTTVMPLNVEFGDCPAVGTSLLFGSSGADALKNVPAGLSCSVPRFSGLVAVYGVEIEMVPAGTVPSIVWASLHVVQAGAVSVKVTGAELDPATVAPEAGTNVATTECAPAEV